MVSSTYKDSPLWKDRFLSNETAQKMLADSLPEMEIFPFFQFRMAQESMIEYTAMPNPDNQKEYVIAERGELSGREIREQLGKI